MTTVRLLEAEGRRLRVRGVDMLDQTPLLDIKPRVPAFDRAEAERYGWLEPHLERLRDGASPPRADDRFQRKRREDGPS